MSEPEFSAHPVRWGIVGLGRIARAFIKDLHLVESAEVAAVGSRDERRARQFCREVGAARHHGSYDSLFADPDVDIVYVATPNDSHADLTVQALEAGKHVLCEKPFALSRAQGERMVAASRANGRFLMEAFWSRFNPTIAEVLERTRNGDLGPVRYISADFSFHVDPVPGSRLVDLARGGGALLDIGVYPLFLAYAVLGMPERVTARTIKHEQGADWQTAIILEYPKAMAVLYCGFASRSGLTATISGERGRFELDPTWHETDSYRFVDDKESSLRFDRPRSGKGFTHEILECHRCIAQGLIESTAWSHADSLALMGIADEVRRQIGLTFPGAS